MLGLATHEPNFTIIREEFKPNKPRPCALCGQMGHEIKDCQGAAREKQGEVSSAWTSEVGSVVMLTELLLEYHIYGIFYTVLQLQRNSKAVIYFLFALGLTHFVLIDY